MPTRRSIALILAFWVSVTSYVLYRDVVPVMFASGPPPIAIDLADEAAQNIPIRWTLTWNGKPAGKLTTQMRYIDSDDTFRFTNDYRGFRYEANGVAVVIPDLRNVTRISRAGDLREQSGDGKMEVYLGDLRIGEATASVVGKVIDGQLIATCEVKSAFGNMTKTLDPVPVPSGLPLNPLQPVNRIAHLAPGREWIVHENNPLDDALATLARQKAAEFGLQLPETKTGPLRAQVLGSEQTLGWHTHEVSCWVIEYRRDGELVAKTWVRVTDGKVLKQEAFKKGENLSIVRDE
ncbi:MAG: hypothetical protein K8U57_26395 [Planctomycetes bacterium]|nr:hypothetical protein [Planctomycetota bacterium]